VKAGKGKNTTNAEDRITESTEVALRITGDMAMKNLGSLTHLRLKTRPSPQQCLPVNVLQSSRAVQL
jgi:hypothetical protein